jgi:hypothetical protein
MRMTIKALLTLSSDAQERWGKITDN